jgi:hypothetical protein
MSRSSRLSRSSPIALWAAVFSLLLKAAVPLLAATAADLRGVPVASVCANYGVAMPARSGGGHAAHAGHGGHAEHVAQAAHQAQTEPRAALHADAGAAGSAAHDGDPSHAEDTHGAGHCALSALAALAVSDPAPTVAPRVRDAEADHAPTRAVAFHDASAAWIAGLKHGPPAAA